MRNALPVMCLCGLLAAIPLGVSAQVEEQQSCDNISELLAGGSSAGDVVRATMATGMNLVEATVFAMVCGGEANREAIATAGIEAAGNLAQAQSVAYAVLATAGQTGPVADAVRLAMDDYARHMPQPDVYQDEFTPTGGGVISRDRPPIGGPQSPAT